MKKIFYLYKRKRERRMYTNALNNNGVSRPLKTVKSINIEEQGVEALPASAQSSGRSAIIYALKVVTNPVSNALSACKLSRTMAGATFSANNLTQFDSSFSDILRGMEIEFVDLAVALNSKGRSGDSIKSIAGFFENRIMDFKRRCEQSANRLSELTGDLKKEYEIASFGKLTKNNEEGNSYENFSKNPKKFGSASARRPKRLFLARRET